MQHAGLQYGQGAANSHQSPPFAHADISFSKQQTTTGGNTTSSLRQFRKKDGLEKTSSTDLNHSISENSHIARVAPHNHYPARPNDYYRYHSQYPDYNSSYKEPIAQVKYSEIAETPPQAIQHVDHIPAALQKHKEPHKDFMDMCNLNQQTHMKQNYPDNLSRQQSYPPDAASMHHQYLHKEPQVHPNYKPESQYQQYPQLAKYNMPSQCRKYQPPPPHENEFLARLQQINPSMARSIMSDHHVRDSQTASYPNQMYPQNQRYYPIQNNPAYSNYHMSQPYNYPSSCNYKHAEYARANQMGGAQYPAPERSLSPRNLHLNYAPQKVSPGYGQYNPPEYAQHYQHRRASAPQDYYQQCRTNPYVPNHQISPQPTDNRASSGLRHFIENWAEEEGVQEIAPIYKENVRLHNEAEQVFVINSSELPQCLENVSLVPTENGQYIIKSSGLDNSVVRIKETTENNGERTVNLQIVEATPKPDCMLAETAPLEAAKPNEEPPTVPYVETAKDCDEATKTVDREEEEQPVSENAEKSETTEASVIVCNEVSVIKDMPLIEEDHDKKAPQGENNEELTPAAEEPEQEVEEAPAETPDEDDGAKEPTELPLDNHVTTTTKRTQRIFSVDDIINNIGSSGAQPRRNSVQLMETYDDNTEEAEDKTDCASEEQKPEEDPPPPPPDEEEEGVEYASAISIEDDSVILEIGGALVQLNINHCNGTKVLSVLPLSESLVIDVNGNYQNCVESMTQENLECETPCEEKITTTNEEKDKTLSEERNEEVVQENVEEVDKEMVEFSNNDKVDQVSEKTVEQSDEDKIDAMEQHQHQEEVQQQVEEEIDTTVCQSEVIIGDESEENEVFIDLNSNSEEKLEKEFEEVSEAKCEEETPPQAIQHVDHTLTEKIIERVNETEETKEVEKQEEVEENKIKPVEIIKKKEKKTTHLEEKKKYKEIEEEKKKPSSSKKVKIDHERKSEERVKTKKAIQKGDEDETKTTKKVKVIPDEDETKMIKKSKVIADEDESKATKKRLEEKPKEEEPKKEEISKKDEKIEKPFPSLSTKAAKKHYVTDSPVKIKQPKEKETKSKTDEKPSKLKIDVKKSMAQLEETVNKIKSMKEKASKKEMKPKESPEIPEKKPKTPKRVTFNLDIHEISKEEIDRKKLSLEEYNIRKRKSPLENKDDKIMENTVTSSEDIGDQVVEQVEQSIENAIKDSALKTSSPKITDSNWEDDPDSPKTSEKSEVMSKSKRCIIDVNEFNIKPIESVSTPSPVSSSQFSYHSEDDSLQVYKDVVDSKLNSLNIKIPKVSKPKALDQVSELLERFLNKSSLNCNELEKVKKIIEFKRKIEEKQLTYEVREEREYKDLKLHFKKVPEKRPKKRFRNLYTEDTSSEDSDSSRSEKAVGDYSVYQRSSHQGVPKLIFKRNSGLPQPFVKLERSQAVELLAKKRKLY